MFKDIKGKIDLRSNVMYFTNIKFTKNVMKFKKLKNLHTTAVKNFNSELFYKFTKSYLATPLVSWTFYDSTEHELQELIFKMKKVKSLLRSPLNEI